MQSKDGSCDVAVRGRIRVGDTLNVLSVYQAFDALLDHIYVGNEAGGKLRQYLCYELRVGEFLALSVERMLLVSAVPYIYGKKNRKE